MEYCFKRYEVKYLLTKAQYQKILDFLSDKIIKDKFYKSTIYNVYYDTPNYELIRKSIEKPIYKEKLRLRCYNIVDTNSDIFLELKKKYDNIVYKRRIRLKTNELETMIETKTQIGKEIEYFNKFYYNLKPMMHLSYNRLAYVYSQNHNIRITFDTDIKWRNKNVNLYSTISDESLLPDGMVLMELKVPLSIPYELAVFLSKEKIFKISFSKYGMAYQKIITERKELLYG